jgi:hypothetical protein
MWRSPAWELQVVRRQLYTSTVISDAQTTSLFLNGHQLVPGCSQLPLYMQQHGHRTAPLQTAQFLRAVSRKKLSGIVNFLKNVEFWRNIMYQMMPLKMHGILAVSSVCQEMVPSSQHPVLAVWGE